MTFRRFLVRPRLAQVLAAFALAVLSIAAPVATGAQSVAKDIIVLIDNSGSMKKNDPEFLSKKAVTEFIENLASDTRAAIIVFDQGVRLAVPLTELRDTGREALLNSLEQVNYRGKLTDSPSAVERAVYELKLNSRPDAERIIVFMTDGIVDVGDPVKDLKMTRWLQDDLAADAANEGIRIFTVAFTEKADFPLIHALASRTNGDYFRVLKPEDLVGAFARINDTLSRRPEPEVAAAAPVEVQELTAGIRDLNAPDGKAPIEAQGAPASTKDNTVEPPLAVQEPVKVEGAKSGSIEQETEIRQEAMQKTPEGTAVAVNPQEKSGGQDIGEFAALVIVVGLIAIGALIGLVFLVKRRSRRQATAMPKHEHLPVAILKDVRGVTDAPRYMIGAKAVMIGRVAGADHQNLNYVVLNQATVGRRHAVIEYKDYSYWIVDQRSVNGTFVNGERITGSQRLKHGDKIRLHSYEFEFSLPELADSDETVLFQPGAQMFGLAGGATTVGRGVSVASGSLAFAAASRAREGTHALQFEEATDDTSQEATLIRKKAVFSEAVETAGKVAPVSIKPSIKPTTSSAYTHSTIAEPKTIASSGESTDRYRANIPVADYPTPVDTNEQAEATRLLKRDVAAGPIPTEAFDHQTEPFGIEVSREAIPEDSTPVDADDQGEARQLFDQGPGAAESEEMKYSEKTNKPIWVDMTDEAATQDPATALKSPDDKVEV